MSSARCHAGPGRRRCRGVIFVTALGIIVILSGLVLVFAQSMRAEALASANRLAYLQADAVEQGAEQWVLAQVQAFPGDAVTITETPAESIPVGSGYFWILRPNPDSDERYDFGISDESGKININTAGINQLLMFPAMSEEAAEGIVDWRDPNASAGLDVVYSALPEPYQAKHANFETVEELLLVSGVTDEMLFGCDLNRDGVVDEAERNASGSPLLFGSGESSVRGLAHYLTAWTTEPNTAEDGSARVNVNRRGSGSALRDAMRNSGMQESRITEVMNRWRQLMPRRGRGPFSNLGDFYRGVGLTNAEFAELADRLTTTNVQTLNGMVNVNTASRDVLMCLPGLSEADADALVSQRLGADTTSIAWVFNALTAAKAGAIAGAITARSYQYSADIVAVSGDGRAYKRVRIVVDAQPSAPARIVYRRDLTALGWPLPAELRQSLRAGTGAVTGFGAAGNAGRLGF